MGYFANEAMSYINIIGAICRDRQNRPARNRVDVPAISYQRLKEMNDDDSLEARAIVLQLSSNESGFKRRLCEDMNNGRLLFIAFLRRIEQDIDPDSSYSGFDRFFVVGLCH